jgi:hypothetical protein
MEEKSTMIQKLMSQNKDGSFGFSGVEKRNMNARKKKK